jgi:hypothetical protein
MSQGKNISPAATVAQTVGIAMAAAAAGVAVGRLIS